MLEPKTREDLDREMENLEHRIDGILRYISDNPTSDPNAYEMNDVMFELADIGFFGRKFEGEPYAFLYDEKYTKLKEKFGGMMQYRLPQLISEEQGIHATHLYDYFNESERNMATLNRLAFDNGRKTRELFDSICGVDLYIHQRKRDLKKQNNMSELIYTNTVENTRIVLDYEEYKEKDNEGLRPYQTRDAIVENIYNEIQNNYNKSLTETLAAEKDNNKKM